MKNFHLIILLFILSFTASSQELSDPVSTSKITAGVSFGAIFIDTPGFNTNVFAGYHVSDYFILGVDGMYGQPEINDITVNTTAIQLYAEGRSPSIPVFEKAGISFSALLGLGHIQHTFENHNRDAFSVYLGANINLKISQKITLGLKTGTYLSEMENATINNLFFAYRF